MTLSIQSIVRVAAGIFLGTSLGATLGCATAPAPGGAPEIPPARRDTIAGIPQHPAVQMPALSLDYGAGRHAYDLDQTTVVTVGADSLSSMQDTLLTRASLSYSIHRSNDTVHVLAVVDSLSVISGRDSTASRRLAGPVSIVLRPRVESPLPAPTDSIPPPTGCDSMEEAAGSIARDVHIPIPPGAQPRQRWADSTAAVVCRGGIPLRVTTVSAFELQDVQTRSDSVIGTVIRRSALTLAGAGTQGSRRIGVTGTGTSETAFRFDLRSGTFVESQGQSVLQLQFETIQQTEQVTQRSVSRVRRRPEGS